MHLLFAGVTTEVCVQTSMREANDRGFDSLIVTDCCGSYFPQFHATTIEMVVAQGGIVGWTAPLSALQAASRAVAPLAAPVAA
jgi:nicotinamidase-related amidase